MGASALLERYGPAIDVIRHDGFEPDAVAYMVVEGENLVTTAKSTGLGVVELASIFERLQPDIVVSVADRYETIATAIAASYMNIPLAHVQGGEITGSIDEKVRHAVTKLADVHLVSTELAAERVIRMGEEPKRGVPHRVPLDRPGRPGGGRGAGTFDPFDLYAGVGHQFRRRPGLRRDHAAPGDDRVPRRREADRRHARSPHARRPSGLLLLAQRGCGLRSDLEAHPPVP